MNLRRRLKEVDAVVDTIAQSGVSLKALVHGSRRDLVRRGLTGFHLQNLAAAAPKEHELTPREKYFVFSRNHRKLVKGFHLVPHFTKGTWHAGLPIVVGLIIVLSTVPHPRGIPDVALPATKYRLKD